ncbi:MAG: transcriptional repressor LexA [Nitrospirae bacterium]|nr:MAG: transcriptional repressor LexA [Nitrospirota bacterium]
MELTRRQRAILEFIKRFIDREGYPPTVREVAREFGYRSPLSAKQHIDALVRKGYLSRTASLSRGIRVNEPSGSALRLPVLGTIRAGSPILARENIEEYISLSKGLFPLQEGFGLRVVGDSMKDAGIMEGDIVIVRPGQEVRNGDIVVALIGDEATVKRFFMEQDRVVLKPEHPDMEPLLLRASEVRVLGRVVGLIRRF